MIKSEMFKIVKELVFDKKVSVFKKGNTEVQLYRPSVLSARFKDYDVKKNFQIWLKEGEREFRPNHLRVMIDLNLRARSREDLKKSLLLAFDNIFYGKDPEKELNKLSKEKLSQLDNSVQIRAKKELDKLPTRNHKHNALTGDLVGFYSQHFWDNKYRIIYTIEDHILKILALWIGKRNDNFYNDLKKYLKKKGKL